MNRTLSVIFVVFTSATVSAQDTWLPPDDIIHRSADIQSEGTRMAAEIFAPRNPPESKLPTVVMCHGWGGLAEHLRPDAIAFARGGYLVVTFDYRGWGASDSRWSENTW